MVAGSGRRGSSPCRIQRPARQGAGRSGKLDSARELRAIAAATGNPEQIRQYSSAARQASIDVRLGDAPRTFVRVHCAISWNCPQGLPAVELLLQRAENGDSLASANVLTDWLAGVEQRLPPGISIDV